jgi:4-hydroxy-tetrahydrodipicolinate reductase
MSIGVEAVRRGLETMISYLGPCDVAIEDVHHKHKKDSPSGTALMLKNTLIEKRKRGQEIMEPVSLRGGEVYGIHKVYFFSSGEVITIEHQAQNRNIFARGALDAARWLVKQKNGFYSFTDIQRGSN